jgi:hypothetical protein
MTKPLSALLASLCALLAAAWAYSAYLENNRFIITNAGGGAVYKTDGLVIHWWRTGLWWPDV